MHAGCILPVPQPVYLGPRLDVLLLGSAPCWQLGSVPGMCPSLQPGTHLPGAAPATSECWGGPQQVLSAAHFKPVCEVRWWQSGENTRALLQPSKGRWLRAHPSRNVTLPCCAMSWPWAPGPACDPGGTEPRELSTCPASFLQAQSRVLGAASPFCFPGTASWCLAAAPAWWPGGTNGTLSCSAGGHRATLSLPAQIHKFPAANILTL